MTISLLDLLSCGLASVVILLMLSLNTGMGEEDKLNQSNFIEITVHGGFLDKFQTEFEDEKDSISVKQKESFFFLGFSPKLDTIGIEGTMFFHTSNFRESIATTLQISIPENAKGIELNFQIERGLGHATIEYNATNTFDQNYAIWDTIPLNHDFANFKLKYTNNTEAQLIDGGGIHNFPTLTSE